jgi:translocation and assembly module TamB
MSSVSQRRPTRRQGSFESQPTTGRRPKPRRWLKNLVLGTTGLTIVALVLPTIIAYTPLRNAPLRFVLKGMHGTVQSSGASLSWFGAIQYTDIEIRDARGELLLAIPKVESDRSLAGMLSNLSDLGAFHIERPQLSLAMRDGGSNLEDVFAEHLAGAKKPQASAKQATKLPTMTAQFVDGSINLTDAKTGQHWQVDKFNLNWTTSPDSWLPADVSITAQVPYDGKAAQLAITSTPGAEGKLDHIDAQIDGVPLALFRSLAERFAPGMQLAGTLSSKLRCACDGGDPARGVQVSGGVAIDGMLATGGPLGTDRLALQKIEIPCQLAFRDRNVTIDQLALSCDIGQVAIAGNYTIPADIDAKQIAQPSRSVISLEGQLDLAKLAALLPSTLRIRSGTQITGGQVRLSLSEKPDVSATLWSGHLLASDLTAIENGRQLNMGQPLSIEFAARTQGSNVSLDQLQCSSSFFTLTGRGSIDQFQASAQCDLDRLMGEISQFIDLGEIRLAGRGDAQINWQRAASGQFQANADARVQSLQIALPGKPIWQEDTITAGIAASGAIDHFSLGNLAGAKLNRLDAARLTATVENAATNSREQFDVQLLQPVVGTSAEISPASAALTKPKYPFSAHLQAQMGRWWPRIAGWLKMDAAELGGATDITAMGTYCDSNIQFQQLRGTINGFHGWCNNALFIDEPAVQLDATGGYNFAASQLALDRASLLTSTVSLQTESAVVGVSAKGPLSLAGNIAYQADLNRLQRWFNDPRLPPQYIVAGRLTGNAGISRTGIATTGKVDAVIDSFAVYASNNPASKSAAALKYNPARSPEPLWNENRLIITANGGFDSLADCLQLAAMQLDSQSLKLHAAGKLERVNTQPNLNLTGKIEYDWQTLGPLLKPILGDNVEIAGHESRDFALRGPLHLGGNDLTLASRASGAGSDGSGQQTEQSVWSTLRPMTGDFSLGCSQASALGMLVGKIDAQAHLEDGLIKFRPIQTTISDRRSGQSGNLNVIPSLQLRSDAGELVLEKSTLLSGVQISQELSNSWLKFIAPVMAESTRTEGTFSLELDSAHIPLDEPTKADVSGRLIVENLEIVPGPLVRPLVLIGQQIEALVKRRPPPLELGREPVLVKIDNQKVDFRMAQGRIYHQSLTMQIGETTIRTRGWVGADETIGLVADVPLRQEWLKNPIFANQRDGIIQVPITGTLKQPKIDNRIIGQLLQGATRGVIENELNKQLDRFLSPPGR